MERAELVVVVRSEGLAKVNEALTKFGKLSEVAAGKVDITGEAFKALLVELQQYIKAISTIERAHKLQENAAKKAGETERAQLKLTWTVAKTLYDQKEHASKKAADAERAHLKLVWSAAQTRYKMEQAIIKQTADLKTKAMNKEHAEALKLNKDITASRKKMWDDAAREAKREAAAQERLRAHPISARVGQALGFVDKNAGAVQQAKQVDLFRGMTFDFLIWYGTAKAVVSMIKNIGQAMVDALQPAIQFESAWAKITQTVTGSYDQLKRVKDEFRDLAATRPFDLDELAAGARALGELGVATNEIAKGTDVILRFSIASGIATDEAATLLGQILATGGVARPTAEDLAKLASAALSMGTNFAIGNKGVLTTMLRVSALIPTFHLTTEAALGLSTAMGSLGIKAERGTSALQLLYSKARSADPDKLERFANVIGMTVDETRNLIKYDIGQFTVKFIEGLKDLTDAGYNTDKMLEELGIKTIRARQAFGQLTGGVLTVKEAYEQANSEWGQTQELMRQSDKQLQTTESLWKTFGNSVTQLAAQIGELFLPEIKLVLIALTGISEALRTINPDPLKHMIDAAQAFPGSGLFTMLDMLIRVHDAYERVQKDKEDTIALAGKGPLALEPLPNPEDIFGIKPPKPYGAYGEGPQISNRAIRDEQLRQQGEDNKAEAKRKKAVETEAKNLVENSRTAAQEYIDTMKVLDEAKREHWITLDGYAQAAAATQEKRDQDEIRAAERTRKEIKKNLDHSASDQQKYNETKAKNDKWLREGVINQAQFDQNMAKAAEDRDKKKLAQLAKDQKEVARFMKEAMSARDKYNATLAKTDKFVKEGRMTPAEADKQKAAALDKLTKAEAKAEAARNRLTAAERTATTLAEKNDPYLKYENTLEKINQAVKEGLSLADEKLAKDQAYLDLLKNIDRQNGVSQKQLDARNKKIKDYAIALNPVADLEAEIAKTRAAMKEFPNIATKMAGEEHIAQLKRDIKLPEEYERQMRIVQGIVERGMNTVADTMTDALFEGTVKGREIMRAFAKDITNILLEEMIFKPTAMKITDAFKDFQIADFTKKMNASAPGNDNSTDLAKAADTTTKSLDELGTGALKALLDLTSGIGSFLIGLLGGSKGGGWNLKDFALTSLWGGLSKGASTFLSGYLGDTPTPPDTTHEVPFSPVGGQSLYDPNSGFTDYNVGSRASSMTYSNAYAGQNTSTGAPPVNVTVTALDPRTAASVIMSNMPVIERGMQRAVDRGAAYAKAHGRRR